MFSSLIRFLLLVSCLACVANTSAQIESPESAEAATLQPSTVGVYVHPPFVMKGDDDLTGMAIDLWEEMAAHLNLDSSYVEFDNVGELIRATESGDIDVALTNMTVTKDRAQRIDFTHPWFDAGQRIMVSTEQGASAGSLFKGLSESGVGGQYN